MKTESEVIRYFMEEEFNQIPKKQLTDFIPEINPTNPEEIDILQLWETHFKERNIPYCIISKTKFINSNYQNIYSLLKQIR